MYCETLAKSKEKKVMNKNRYYVSFLFIFSLFSLSITGCGDLKITSYFNPSDPKLNKYKTLEIVDFETEITDVPNEALTRIPDEVAKLIVSKNICFYKLEVKEDCEEFYNKSYENILKARKDGTNIRESQRALALNYLHLKRSK